jgi:ankyrin repeat protein
MKSLVFLKDCFFPFMHVIILVLALSFLLGGCAKCREAGNLHDSLIGKHLPLEKEYIDFVGSMLDEKNVNCTDGRGRTLLYKAALSNDLLLARVLLEKKADPNIGASWKNDDGPLHVASRLGYLNMVKLLVESGANVNKKNSAGATPLLQASWHTWPDVVKELLNNGAVINIADATGMTALHINITEEISSNENYKKTVKLLIREGADVNAGSVEGRDTPLHSACLVGDAEIVGMLIYKGALLYAENENGDSPYCCLLRSAHSRLREIALKYPSPEQECVGSGSPIKGLVK